MSLCSEIHLSFSGPLRLVECNCTSSGCSLNSTRQVPGSSRRVLISTRRSAVLSATRRVQVHTVWLLSKFDPTSSGFISSCSEMHSSFGYHLGLVNMSARLFLSSGRNCFSAWASTLNVGLIIKG